MIILYTNTPFVKIPIAHLIAIGYINIMLDYVGLQKTTLIDFPGEVAATVFTRGCNMRCPYCHNPELVRPNSPSEGLYPLVEVKAFLEKRKNRLGGVCITGGEPLIHPDLPAFIDYIHSLGMKVKLDTNGSFPEKLAALKPDYVAMDIKTAPPKYPLIGYTGKADIVENMISSIRWIIESGTDHEFRTTVVPGIVDVDDIRAICKLIEGAARYNLAGFRPGLTLDPEYSDKQPYHSDVLAEMKEIIEGYGISCMIRGK